MVRHTVAVLILISVFNLVNAGDNPGKTFFIEPEWMIGKNIPIYDNFPKSALRQNLLFNFGYIHTDSTQNWVSYYNYPTIGISAVFSALGNREVLSSEFGLIPYVLLKSSRNPRKSFDFKLGLGITYDIKPYNKEWNPDNLAFSSNVNWGFHLLMYKNILVSRKINIKSGIGFLHTSNAHTVLPNYGLNSFVLSMAFQFPRGNLDPMFALKQNKLPLDYTKHYFLQARYGFGWHKLGGTEGPSGGPTYRVSSYSLSGGILLRQQMKLRAGITYRYYDSYYNYILKTPDSLFQNSPDQFRHNPRLEASAINIFIGCEFLIGHFGFDMEGGYNVYKPFYKEYNDRWAYNKGFEYWRARYLSIRLGANYYLINTSKKPRHNLLIGTHVNANYTKADFMDVSLAYVYHIN
jgi:hypothetical protein